MGELVGFKFDLAIHCSATIGLFRKGNTLLKSESKQIYRPDIQALLASVGRGNQHVMAC